MGAHCITGYAGKEHITAADQGMYNAGTLGTGKYVLPIGSMFEAVTITNNLIKIKDGCLVNQGRNINIAVNDYEECEIDNGIQALKRNDLIVIRYEKNADTGIETASTIVIKGVSGETAVDPEYTKGNIFNGDNVDDFPLYRVKLEGLNITAVEPLFNTIVSFKGLIDMVDSLNEGLANTNKSVDALNTNLGNNNENLIPYPYCQGTVIKDGITFADNGDGTFTFNGTATKDTAYNFTSRKQANKFKIKKGTYTISGISGGSLSTYYFTVGRGTNDSYNGTLITVLDGPNTFVLSEELAEDEGIQTTITIKEGATLNNITIKPMLEYGSIAHEYKPYSLSNAGLQKQIDNDVVHNSNISSSTAITETGKYALDATEKNAFVDGTLANQIGTINTNLDDVKATVAAAVVPGANALTFSSDTVFTAQGAAHVNKSGKMAFIHTIFKINSAITQNNLIAIIPDGYKPSVSYSDVPIARVGSESAVTVNIGIDGAIKVKSSSIPAGMYELNYAYAIA